MRMVFMIMVLAFMACRSETGLRHLEVSTEMEINLPLDALYGNVSAFTGFHAASPDLFVDEKIEEIDGRLRRTLTLSNAITLVDELMETDDDERLIKYRTTTTSLPVDEIFHTIKVKEITGQKCEVDWVSSTIAENQHRDFIDERITEIQVTYLLSLQQLGKELDELLNDPYF